MSECVKNCKLCDRFIMTQAISFNAAVNQLIVDLPAGSYARCQKYCIVFAQPIPANATLNAQVVFTIGGDQTIGYPFLNKDCTPVYASQVRARKMYASKVETNVTPARFKYIGKCCLPDISVTGATAIPIP